MPCLFTDRKTTIRPDSGDKTMRGSTKNSHSQQRALRGIMGKKGIKSSMRVLMCSFCLLQHGGGGGGRPKQNKKTAEHDNYNVI